MGLLLIFIMMALNLVFMETMDNNIVAVRRKEGCFEVGEHPQMLRHSGYVPASGSEPMLHRNAEGFHPNHSKSYRIVWFLSGCSFA